jgi:HlyD family secretion protein
MSSLNTAVSIYRRLFFLAGIVAFTASIYGLIQSGVVSQWSRPEIPPELTDVEPVRRVRFDSYVNAPGEIQSANNTIVECEIENLTLRVQGRSIDAGKSTRILTIVPDGTKVQKGDVLCTLDSREFEEVVRLQRINVERAKSDKLQAEMELEVAKIAMEEFRNGKAKQQVQTLNGLIALAQTDSTRLTGRLEWARKMLDKGYLSKTSIRLEEIALQRSDMQLTQAMTQLNTYEKYSMPKQVHQLQTRITSLETNCLMETKRYERYLERLESYEKQIANCSVKAPHDGMVIYANEDDGDSRIELGAEVRQGQDLFYLPDLEDMQVMARLSESIVKKVKSGMAVRVLVESVNGISCEGTVEKIAQFPIPPSSWRASSEVKNYYCIVKINGKPDGLRPGLNSEIQIMTDAPSERLTISPNVVNIQQEREFCYVLTDDRRIEKREIRTRTGDPYTLEVLEGLNEGDKVLVNHSKIVDNKDLVTRVVNLGPKAQTTVKLVNNETPLDVQQPSLTDENIARDEPSTNLVPALSTTGTVLNGY